MSSQADIHIHVLKYVEVMDIIYVCTITYVFRSQVLFTGILKASVLTDMDFAIIECL